jgi:hypothetical protein
MLIAGLSTLRAPPLPWPKHSNARPESVFVGQCEYDEFSQMKNSDAVALAAKSFIKMRVSWLSAWQSTIQRRT